MFRWIQLSEDEVKCYKEKKLVRKNSGYKYTCRNTGEKKVEYHVDTCRAFMDKMNKETEFGRNLSVRMLPCQLPLVVMGQDECIVKQYSFTPKSWVGPKGEQALIPKDEGYGIMISAFQSREFGFGMTLTEAQLQTVNAERAGTKYKDEEAATAKRGTALKQPLTSSPFVLEFEYGVSAEGYWMYESMVLQLEDCADVVKTLYPQYQFLFLFDHSCGHDKAREDALNVRNMNKGFGGSKPKMHDTVIHKAKGYLGPFEHDKKLRVGDIQSMVFRAEDEGPFWLKPEQREATRHDELLTMSKSHKFNKGELQTQLAARGITARGNAEQVRAVARQNGLPLEYEKQDVNYGWEGKPKGIEQVLWERGWIDGNRRKDYTMDGKKDSKGVLKKETSLFLLMSDCTDFEGEESLLQTKGKEMGILVDRTPKCHCELAGEGIECSWGCAKNHYRRLPLAEKKGKQVFRETVRKCFSREVITTERVRLFSQRARAYTLAYYAMRQQQLSNSGTDENAAECDSTATPVNIEKLVKAFKTHRCAMDFDSAFCKAVFLPVDDSVAMSTTAP